jgi:hypothetical protein
MNTSATQRINSYTQRVTQLFEQIRQWLDGSDFTVDEDSIEIREEDLGLYTAPRLHVLGREGRHVADIEPRGAAIIGAEGRVDIAGAFDRQVIVYLRGKGPQMHSHEIQQGHVRETQSYPLFSGVTDDGWYWIEEVRLGRARLLNRELFHDLLVEVSDYA